MIQLQIRVDGERAQQNTPCNHQHDDKNHRRGRQRVSVGGRRRRTTVASSAPIRGGYHTVICTGSGGFVRSDLDQQRIDTCDEGLLREAPVGPTSNEEGVAQAPGESVGNVGAGGAHEFGPELGAGGGILHEHRICSTAGRQTLIDITDIAGDVQGVLRAVVDDSAG